MSAHRGRWLPLGFWVGVWCWVVGGSRLQIFLRWLILVGRFVFRRGVDFSLRMRFLVRRLRVDRDRVTAIWVVFLHFCVGSWTWWVAGTSFILFGSGLDFVSWPIRLHLDCEFVFVAFWGNAWPWSVFAGWVDAGLLLFRWVEWLINWCLNQWFFRHIRQPIYQGLYYLSCW